MAQIDDVTQNLNLGIFEKPPTECPSPSFTLLITVEWPNRDHWAVTSSQLLKVISPKLKISPEIIYMISTDELSSYGVVIRFLNSQPFL